MNPFVKVILYAGLLQLVAITGLSLYLFSHIQDKERKYSLMAERNAIEASSTLNFRYYSQIIQDRNLDRQEMKL
ncbi:hypothetical protein ACVWYU_001721 [Pseudomonas sp. TE12234]